jgi:hypothetical protein
MKQYFFKFKFKKFKTILSARLATLNTHSKLINTFPESAACQIKFLFRSQRDKNERLDATFSTFFGG